MSCIFVQQQIAMRRFFTAFLPLFYRFFTAFLPLFYRFFTRLFYLANA
jgi:hypothetical protein